MILESRRKTPKTEKKVLSVRKPRRTVNGVKQTYPKGRVIRVSGFIFSLLQNKLRNRESWDQFFRRFLNIPQRDGSQEKLFECWVLSSTGETFKSKALARGKAIQNGVFKGNKGKFEEPVRVREIV